MPPAFHDVACLDDLPDGGMREGEADGEKILLFREGDAVHAVSATCPHAGAPLAQGVRHGARIVCPWHKAIFCLRSGALLEPPAVDPLSRYDVRIEGQRVLVARAEPTPTPDQSAGADAA
jgi:nitrite reductase/ring-hydroxylating ferredoxin subunit